MSEAGVQLRLGHWSDDTLRPTLQLIRRKVFIEEQSVPEALEWDELDAQAWHLLACDADGTALGCGRLTRQQKIGRMAVLPPGRGRGVGQALLRGLINQARANGWSQVALDAQLHALGFYAREGFEAYGEVFDDAGIAHRAMRLRLA